METLIVFSAEYLIYVVAVAVGVFWLTQPRDRKVRLVLLGAVSGVCALLLTYAANHLYYDPRPFVVGHFRPLLLHDPDNGFPSDHTVVLSLASFCIMLVSRPMGIVLLVCTLLVGAARVAAGVHSPLDIVASIIIGAIACLVGYLVERRIRTKRRGAAATDNQVRK